MYDAPELGKRKREEDASEQVIRLQSELKKVKGEMALMRTEMRIDRLLSYAQAEGIRLLMTGDGNLYHIPTFFFISGNKELELTGQGFTSKSLPHFGQNYHAYMQSITCLDLSFNNLERFPDGLCSLVGLSDLYLSHNKIRTIPRSLGNTPPRLHQVC